MSSFRQNSNAQAPFRERGSGTALGSFVQSTILGKPKRKGPAKGQHQSRRFASKVGQNDENENENVVHSNVANRSRVLQNYKTSQNFKAIPKPRARKLGESAVRLEGKHLQPNTMLTTGGSQSFADSNLNSNNSAYTNAKLQQQHQVVRVKAPMPRPPKESLQNIPVKRRAAPNADTESRSYPQSQSQTHSKISFAGDSGGEPDFAARRTRNPHRSRPHSHSHSKFHLPAHTNTATVEGQHDMVMKNSFANHAQPAVPTTHTQANTSTQKTGKPTSQPQSQPQSQLQSQLQSQSQSQSLREKVVGTIHNQCNSWQTDLEATIAALRGDIDQTTKRAWAPSSNDVSTTELPATQPLSETELIKTGTSTDMCTETQTALTSGVSKLKLQEEQEGELLLGGLEHKVGDVHLAATCLVR